MKSISISTKFSFDQLWMIDAPDPQTQALGFEREQENA